MTTAATTSQPSAGLVPLFAGILRSEARKLGTVRSTLWALLATVAFNAVTEALLGALLPGHLSEHQKATIDSVRVSLGGLHLSQIAVGLLGVLAVTSEYSSGKMGSAGHRMGHRRPSHAPGDAPPEVRRVNAPGPRGPSAWTAGSGPCGPSPADSRSAPKQPTRRTCGASRISSPGACRSSAGAST